MTLSVQLITFNAGRCAPDPILLGSHLANLHKSDNSSSSSSGRRRSDILVLALQELAPLSDAFLSSTGNASYLKPYYAAFNDTIDLLRQIDGADYKCMVEENVGMTAILVFALEGVECSDIQTARVGFGFAHMMGNKGAIAVRMKANRANNSPTPLTFVAVHLAPMEWAVERRNSDWKALVQGLVFNNISTATTEPETTETTPLLHAPATPKTTSTGIYTPSTTLFLAGDLNYRTSSTSPSPIEARCKFPQPCPDDDTSYPRHHWHLFTSGDQLRHEQAAGRTCHALLEAPVDFPPTYKYSDQARTRASLLSATYIHPKLKSVHSQTTTNTSNTDQSSSSAKSHVNAELDEFDAQDREDAPEEYLWASHRWPSWCDRVLYRPGHQTRVVPGKYISLPLLPSSDHQPVSAEFLCEQQDESELQDLRPPYDLDPFWRGRRRLAVGLEIVAGSGMKVLERSTLGVGLMALAAAAAAIALAYFAYGSA